MPDIDMLTMLVIAVAVLLTGISKSGFAGAIGGITVPLMSLVISPALAAALLLPILIIADVLSLRQWWGQQSNQHLWLLVPAALLGIVVGYVSFGWLDENGLRLLLGVITLLFALNMLLKLVNQSHLTSAWAGRLLGALSGFTSFVAHAGGPPLNMYLLPQHLPKAQYLATAVVFFSAVNLLKLPPYILLGQLNTTLFVYALLSLPLVWLGVKLGMVLQHNISEQVFYKLISISMLLLGLRLIYTALFS
ncbi:sulfite exporter TauE/SafE family protein [Rheinheimera baltica]|uniref:sulfite exporter TauE/SafE family protein n=1 Tax=Rheinheimera baltica TaxID=67576 RepID=UPI00273D484F|nr:sulfite exporter TauE/SafE family protein [Rheinheimera baltica]MDP5148462.1 sulfite exporter TauE/SafE family protein [Rheinheimera baltica]MDP5188895.1 sulfite exporter TauE/SafE family protein [Rheinheimera baltica]